ncbi:hypothetical protein Tco_1240437 [Tanacetum coccineum]
MAASVIPISLDLLDESVRSSILRVILIDSTFVEVLVAPEVGVTVVGSPAGIRKVDTHSSSKADPLENSLPLVSIAPMVSHFLCSDDSESDTEIPERHVSPAPHDAMLTRWRSRVESRPSSPTTSTLKIPTAPIPPAPSAIVTPSTNIMHHPGFIDDELFLFDPALRYTSHHLDRFTSGSSSNHSSSDHSSSGHSISDQSSFGHSTSSHSLSEHTSPVTTISDSSTPSRFVYPLLARTSWYIEAYCR